MRPAIGVAPSTELSADALVGCMRGLGSAFGRSFTPVPAGEFPKPRQEHATSKLLGRRQCLKIKPRPPSLIRQCRKTTWAVASRSESPKR